MKLDWSNLPRPIVALSPMADMTDSAFCQTVREVVEETVPKSRLIVFREMVSSEAVIRGNDKTLGMAEIHPRERPIVQQIFGADPDAMAESARIIEEEHAPEGIDINMGCPVYKLTSNFNGAALMKEPERAVKIVKQMKAAISVPLSVKMRAGWENHNECIEFAKIIEDAGADLITVHGRTKKQAYAGKSNRDVVAEVKKAVSVPVLYNGDVFDWQDYFAAIDHTDCDGVLIARGGLGNPWIFAQIEQSLAGETPFEVSLTQRINVAKQHLGMHLAQYGDTKINTFRKHLSWYFKGIEHMKPWKQPMMTASDKQTLISILDDLKQSHPINNPSTLPSRPCGEISLNNASV